MLTAKQQQCMQVAGCTYERRQEGGVEGHRHGGARPREKGRRQRVLVLLSERNPLEPPLRMKHHLRSPVYQVQ